MGLSVSGETTDRQTEAEGGGGGGAEEEEDGGVGSITLRGSCVGSRPRPLAIESIDCSMANPKMVKVQCEGGVFSVLVRVETGEQHAVFSKLRQANREERRERRAESRRANRDEEGCH